jgi:hypothetical protein
MEIRGFIDLGADDAEEIASLIPKTGNKAPTPKKSDHSNGAKGGTLCLNMMDRKRKGKLRTWEFKIPPEGVDFYQAVMDLANDFNVKKLHKMSGSGAHSAGITSPELARKGISKANSSIYRPSSTTSNGSTGSGGDGTHERCKKCNTKSKWCLCDTSNESTGSGGDGRSRMDERLSMVAAGAEKMAFVGGKMVSWNDAPAATAEGGFVALSQRPAAIKLKQKLDAQNEIRNVFDLPPEQWKAFETPIKLYIEDEIRAAAFIPTELRKNLRLLEKHKPMYDDAMKDVRLDVVFPGMTNLLEEMQERVQARSAIEYAHNNGKPCQGKSQLQQVYNEGRGRVEKLYKMLLRSLAAQSNCKYIPAENKGVIRCFEKMGLKIEKKWDASCLTDIVRGALEMPAGALSKGKQALKILQGYDADESEHTPYHASKYFDIRIVDVKNRWNASTEGGWCDALITFYFTTDFNKHICEIQFVHEVMMNIRSKLDAHRAYGVFRSAFELLEATGSSTMLEGTIAVASGGGRGGGGGGGGSCSSGGVGGSISDRGGGGGGGRAAQGNSNPNIRAGRNQDGSDGGGAAALSGKTCAHISVNGMCTRPALRGSSLRCYDHTCQMESCTRVKSSAATYCDAHR